MDTENKEESKTESEEKILIELWKQTLDMQKHFNDLSFKIRGFLMTIITGLLGASTFFDDNLSIGIIKSLIAFIILSGIAILFIDLWYHIYLKAAVKQGMEIEKKFPKKFYECINLTTEISKASKKIGGSIFRLILFYSFIIVGVIVSFYLLAKT